MSNDNNQNKQFLDKTGLETLWGRICEIFVPRKEFQDIIGTALNDKYLPLYNGTYDETTIKHEGILTFNIGNCVSFTDTELLFRDDNNTKCIAHICGGSDTKYTYDDRVEKSTRLIFAPNRPAFSGDGIKELNGAVCIENLRVEPNNSDSKSWYTTFRGGTDVLLGSPNYPWKEAHIDVLNAKTINGGISLENISVSSRTDAKVSNIPGYIDFNTLSSDNHLWINSYRTGAKKITGYNFLNGSNDGNYAPLYASNFIIQSDKRSKKNITKLENASKSLDLNFYEFDYISDDKHSAGHIAQEVQKVYPEFVHTHNNDVLSLDYNALHTLQIKALKDENDLLKQQISELSARLKKLETLINNL